MRDQLLLLEELQRHDARIQELDGAHRAIPAKLQDLKRDLGRLEELLAREKGQLGEVEKMHVEKKSQLEADSELQAKTKHKVAQVKNSKEYMATQREAEALRKIVADAEETLGSLTQGATQMRDKISDHEGDVEKLRQIVAAEETAAQEKIGHIEAEITKARTAREAAATAVRADVMKRYTAIRMRRGLAVVPVVAGTCRGCNMRIPPQLYNNLQRGNSIELCPTCNRIIYWDKLLADNSDGAPVEAAPPPPVAAKKKAPKKAPAAGSDPGAES